MPPKRTSSSTDDLAEAAATLARKSRQLRQVAAAEDSDPGSVPPNIAALFAQIDRNGDGSISRAELIKALRNDSALQDMLELPGQVQASAVCCTDPRARACNGLSVARINGVPS